MLIECILKRPGGSVVEMPGKTYHFKPQPDGRHIAEVTIESHIERFLSIPDGYRIARTADGEPPAVFEPKADDDYDPVPPVSDTILGSNQLPGVFEIGGKTYTQAEVVARAFADSGLTSEDWNTLDEETRTTKIEIVLDAIEAGEIDLPSEPAVEAPKKRGRKPKVKADE